MNNHIVNQINIEKNMSITDFMNQLDNSGVLGAGRVARSCNLLSEMISNPEMKVFMSLAGPLVPGGLRKIVSSMIKNGHVDVLFTSGANVTHDLLESFGGSHYRDKGFDDEELNSAGLGRIGDIYTSSDDFEVFEKEIEGILTKISQKTDYISIKDLLYEIGLCIDDEDSILKAASENNIPIYAPGLIDSMLGLHLWMFTQDHKLVVDVVADMHGLSDLVFEAKEVGGIILGGGLPKHYLLASNLLKGGLDAAIQITMDRSESGSLSGAPLEEAKSWSKARCGSNLVSVIGDVTLIFPLIYAAALDKIN